MTELERMNLKGLVPKNTAIEAVIEGVKNDEIYPKVFDLQNGKYLIEDHSKSDSNNFTWFLLRDTQGKFIAKTKITDLVMFHNFAAYGVNGLYATTIPGLIQMQKEADQYPEIDLDIVNLQKYYP